MWPIQSWSAGFVSPWFRLSGSGWTDNRIRSHRNAAEHQRTIDLESYYRKRRSWRQEYGFQRCFIFLANRRTYVSVVDTKKRTLRSFRCTLMVHFLWYIKYLQRISTTQVPHPSLFFSSLRGRRFEEWRIMEKICQHVQSLPSRPRPRHPSPGPDNSHSFLEYNRYTHTHTRGPLNSATA